MWEDIKYRKDEKVEDRQYFSFFGKSAKNIILT